MKNLRLTVAVVVVLAVLVFGVGTFLAPSTPAAGDPTFTNKTVKGTWGFSASGTILPPALPAATLAVAVGVIEFDGEGGCTITDQVNIGGTAIPPTGFRTSTSCDYDVNSDGTGTFTVLFASDPGPTPVAFVIAGKGHEIQLIRTDLGVAIGLATRQR